MAAEILIPAGVGGGSQRCNDETSESIDPMSFNYPERFGSASGSTRLLLAVENSSHLDLPISPDEEQQSSPHEPISAPRRSSALVKEPSGLEDKQQATASCFSICCSALVLRYCALLNFRKLAFLGTLAYVQ